MRQARSDMYHVLEKVGKIAQKASSDRYIFRGESKKHCRVSSKLYREYKEHLSEYVNIYTIRNEHLKQAKEYMGERPDIEILTEIQHYHGTTNLIDFTTDLLVALFFACSGDFEFNGRLIFFSRSATSGYVIREPEGVAHRVTAQKSLFVESPKGFIEKNHFESVEIEANLKVGLLDYLREVHGLSDKYIYKDVHGYMRIKNIQRKAEEPFLIGMGHFNSGRFRKAICSYTKSIKIFPIQSKAYNNRGASYLHIKDPSAARKDFDRALELDPRNFYALLNRAVESMMKCAWKEAHHDLSNLRPIVGNVGRFFRDTNGSIEEFELKHRVNLPEEIRNLLT